MRLGVHCPIREEDGHSGQNIARWYFFVVFLAFYQVLRADGEGLFARLCHLSLTRCRSNETGVAVLWKVVLSRMHNIYGGSVLQWTTSPLLGGRFRRALSKAKTQTLLLLILTQERRSCLDFANITSDVWFILPVAFLKSILLSPGNASNTRLLSVRRVIRLRTPTLRTGSFCASTSTHAPTLCLFPRFTDVVKIEDPPPSSCASTILIACRHAQRCGFVRQGGTGLLYASREYWRWRSNRFNCVYIGQSWVSTIIDSAYKFPDLPGGLRVRSPISSRK